MAVLTVLTATSSFAEHKVEVTDVIALPGKFSTGTPYNHYTRLILDSSGNNVYGVSDSSNDIPNERATHWSGTNYTIKTDLGSFKDGNSGMSQITAIAQDGKILGGIAHATTTIHDRIHAGIWSGENFANKRQIMTEDPARSTSYLYALSGDGKIIAGSSSGYSRLAILKNDGSNWTDAILLPKLLYVQSWWDIDDSQVLALNYDGSVAVGGSMAITSGVRNTRPVVWTGND